MAKPKELRTVLICVATSPRAAAVVSDGIRVAALLAARPCFLHVGPETSERHDWLRDVLAASVPGGTWSEDQVLVRAGPPAEAIVNVAQAIDAGLILLGALDRDRPITRLLGSVARRVARSAPCSVMLLPEPRLRQQPGIQRIVASVAMDEESVRMVELVLSLARRADGATIHFVYQFSVSEARWITNFDPEGEGAGPPMTTEEYIARRRLAEQHQMAEFLSGFDLEGLAMSVEVLAGEDGTEMLKHAHDKSADLLVMPAPRRLGVLERLAHHPIEVVLGRLPCALLLYRQHSDGQEGRDLP
jgi:nucleotide-binding universal stress UspA family protein